MNYTEYGPIGRKIGDTWLIFDDEALSFLAAHLYTLKDRNAGNPDFLRYDEIPDHAKARWIRKARDLMLVLLDKTKIRPHISERVKDQERAVNHAAPPDGFSASRVPIAENG